MDEADTDGDCTMSQQQDDEEAEWEEVVEYEEVLIDEPEEEQILSPAHAQPADTVAAPVDEDEKYNPEDNIFGDANDAAFDDDDFGDDDFNDDDGGGWDDDEELADINGDNAIQTQAKNSLFESSIPDITRKSIMSNCDEINMVPLFAASADLKSRSRVGAMVGIRVENLSNITSEQLEVWGLTKEFPYIALKVGTLFLSLSLSLYVDAHSECCFIILCAV